MDVHFWQIAFPPGKVIKNEFSTKFSNVLNIVSFQSVASAAYVLILILRGYIFQFSSFKPFYLVKISTRKWYLFSLVHSIVSTFFISNLNAHIDLWCQLRCFVVFTSGYILTFLEIFEGKKENNDIHL